MDVVQLSIFPKLFQKGEIVRFCNRDHKVKKIIEPGDGEVYYEFVDMSYGGVYVLGNVTIEKRINDYVSKGISTS